MASLRSLVIVEAELVKLGLQPVDIGMGDADVLEDLTTDQHLQLRIALRQSGLELLENKLEILIQRIKYIILDIVYNFEEPPAQNLSDYLSTRLQYDYNYMSNVFSDLMNTTIERFYICHKIERVKQLLLYEGLTLTEIAKKMRYSSPAHLSSQFKKITGWTPSQFKLENRDKRPVPGNCG